MKVLLGWVLGIAVVLGIIAALNFGGSLMGLWHYSFFAPKFEEARHETYKHSTAFVDGTMNAVSDMQIQYNAAKAAGDVAGTAAIAATLRHRLADVDYTTFPPHLRSFVAEVVGR